MSTSVILATTAQVSEHNAEYNPFFIKSKYPEMIEEFNIPLDEYPRRCIKQIEGWEKEREDILKDGKIGHERSKVCFLYHGGCCYKHTVQDRWKCS